VIRQAISCDICASEKRQTNHWFVAYEQGGELRVSGWSSRHKLRPGSKHLCGQTCLHKLVDEFMAKAIAVRGQRPVEEPMEEIASAARIVGDASLTSDAAYPDMASANSANSVSTHIDLESSARIIEPQSSARIITPPAVAPPACIPPVSAYRAQPDMAPQSPAPTPPLLPRSAYRPQPELVPPRQHPAELVSSPAEPPRFASRNWRAEAWERERERELRAMGKHPGNTTRRASNA
jgi:hypothetical protein